MKTEDKKEAASYLKDYVALLESKLKTRDGIYSDYLGKKVPKIKEQIRLLESKYEISEYDL